VTHVVAWRFPFRISQLTWSLPTDTFPCSRTRETVAIPCQRSSSVCLNTSHGNRQLQDKEGFDEDRLAFRCLASPPPSGRCLLRRHTGRMPRGAKQPRQECERFLARRLAEKASSSMVRETHALDGLRRNPWGGRVAVDRSSGFRQPPQMRCGRRCNQGKHRGLFPYLLSAARFVGATI
jgi:hypothetical protein